MTQHLDTIPPEVLTTCLSTCRKVLARVQPAWNVWDVTEKLNKSKLDSLSEHTDVAELETSTDVAKEATESNPGSVNALDNIDNEATVTKEETVSDSHESLSCHENLVNNCKELFLKLFSDLVESKIVSNPRSEWKKIIVTRQGADSKQQGLETLLDQVLNSSSDIGNSCESETNHQRVGLREQSEVMKDAFSLACNCILDLSSMPKYHNSAEESPQSDGVDSELPDWLLALLLCSTVQSQSLTSIQLSAITAMVELSTLVIHVSERSEQKQVASEAVEVSMEPVMTSDQLTMVLTNTDTVVRIAETLWSSLELSTTSSQCVSLLHRLISLARHGQVETVVADNMSVATQHSPGQYESFAMLWHLSRDMSANRSAVDLCTMKMVAGLRGGQGSVRAICSRWVEQCVARGVVGRMVEPLLLSLLDPATSRVSVLHAGITRVRGNVYSIKCGDNKVVFHGHKSQESPRDVAKKYSDIQEEEVSHQRRFPYRDNGVNPFALVSSESEYNQDPSVTPEPNEDDKDSASVSACSSVAPSLSPSPSTPKKQTNRSHSIVASLITEFISRAVDTSCFVLDLSQLSAFDQDASDTSVNIHPLHSHLLLYSGQVDTRAALFTLHCIQDMVSVHPRLCVSSLATTSLSSHSLPRSSRLIHLLARHRQAIYGKGFAAPLSSDISSSYRSSMMLECLLSVCLFYVRSYFPRVTELSESDILGNRELRLEAVTTLTKVLTELVGIVKDNGKPFALYIQDLLSRCKLQKVVLHCLLSSVYQLANLEANESFTQKILEYNDITNESSKDLEAFQGELLKLVMAIVMLEEVIGSKKSEEGKQGAVNSSSLLKYHTDQPFCCQVGSDWSTVSVLIGQ